MRIYLLIGFLAAAALASGQTTGARVQGIVEDPSGGTVAGARVTATNLETGQARTATTGAAGSYVLYPLAPGEYDIVCEAAGFRKERLERLKLEVAAVVAHNIRLTLGAVEQSVNISAEAAPALTQSISVESTITREQVQVMPLNGRDFNQLVLLAAGAVENVSTNINKDFGAVAANGNRAFSNDYLLDGTPNNDVFQGRSAAPVSVDLIREFKVTSGVAPAEFGQAGTQVSIVTRGGTNQLHGGLFEFHRGNTLEARNPFNPSGVQFFLRNQFGGTLGGPVRRDRSFFLFNYEGSRQTQNVTRVATVPLEEFWRGDFSSLLARKITLRDPFDPARPTIPGNRLDQYLGGARIKQTALALRPFWGAPNLEGLANNLVQFPRETANGNQYTLRFDQTLPASQTLGVRFTDTRSSNFAPSVLGNKTGVQNPVDTKNLSISWAAPWGPHRVNEVRFGIAGYDAVTTYEDGGLPTTKSLGLQGFEGTSELIPPMARISFSGNDAFTQLNYGSSEGYGMAALKRVSRMYSFGDVFTWAQSRHTVKAGFELRRTNLPVMQQTNASGQLTFRASTGAASTGYTFADFLTGIPSSTQEVPLKEPVLLRQTELAGYVQDDWRLTRRATLSLGLRYEVFRNPVEDKNRLAMFDMPRGAIVVATDNGKLPADQFLPAVVARLQDATGKWRFPLLTDVEAGMNPRRLLDTGMQNWGPRVGLVFQAGNRSVVRLGYGTFYTRYPIQYLLQTISINPPFAGLFTHSQVFTNGVPSLTLDAPYAKAASASVSPAGIQRDFALPNNQQWNLTIERDMGRATALSVGYVGNKGTHLYRTINANGTFLDAAGVVRRRFQDTFGTSGINYRQTNGNSTYHALQTEVRRRAARGLMFQGSWTWAKGIDDVGTNVQSAMLDVENLGRDRADSDYVRRHLLKLNASYDLPFGRGHMLLKDLPRWADRWLASGWRVAGIWQYSTGMRFTPQFASTGGLSNNRPDVVAGVAANLPRDQRTVRRWFNPAAFAEVPAADPVTGRPRFGNAGRNILIGPGLNVMDASLAKSFPAWNERWRLNFRLELFNAANHANYDFPDYNISNTNTVGRINRVTKPLRQAQFALRLDF